MATQHEKELEKLEKSSKKTGIATLLGALIVIGALAYSTYELTRMQKKVDELDQQIVEKENTLSELTSEAEALQASIEAARAELMSIEADPDQAEGLYEKSQTALQKLDQAAESSAKIASTRLAPKALTVNEMMTCQKVEDRAPVECGDAFPPSRVYMWTSLNVPASTTVTIRWMNSDGEVVRSNDIDVNASTNYRINDWKTFREPEAGSYTVSLYDNKGNQIGSQAFTITAE